MRAIAADDADTAVAVDGGDGCEERDVNFDRRGCVHASSKMRNERNRVSRTRPVSIAKRRRRRRRRRQPQTRRLRWRLLSTSPHANDQPADAGRSARPVSIVAITITPAVAMPADGERRRAAATSADWAAARLSCRSSDATVVGERYPRSRRSSSAPTLQQQAPIAYLRRCRRCQRDSAVAVERRRCRRAASFRLLARPRSTLGLWFGLAFVL